ncbi:ribonuclease N1 [Nocardioides antri]|uniref:Ribonuclease N1 n=1 Tax=Nocardioides antri TaxID=2607659 RepID=A0A5B1M9F4_9ACTN|nr:ribonuclease N1 [Nocardioides antri]
MVAVLTAVVWWLQGGTDDGGSAEDPAPSYSTSAPEIDETSGLPYVALEDLPPEAADTVALIDAGGPFPYEKDGSTFGNYEGLLPDHEDGYYREYTVETPGSPDRGARRIVGGAEGELYWTEDHYESFEVIWR